MNTTPTKLRQEARRLKAMLRSRPCPLSLADKQSAQRELLALEQQASDMTPRPGVEYIATYDAQHRWLTYWKTRSDMVTAKGCDDLSAATDMLARLTREGFALPGQQIVEG